MITGEDEEEKTKILVYAEQEYYRPFFFPRLDTDNPKELYPEDPIETFDYLNPVLFEHVY